MALSLSWIPKTGQILAHATAPTFNPNNTKNVPLALMRNPSVQDVYEPGSTGKVMTIAAALEEKKVTPTSIFSVPYSMKVAFSTFHDHERHPTENLTTTGILAESSNTGAIKIGEKLKDSVLYSYLRKFGVGTNTGSGLPGESDGVLAKVSHVERYNGSNGCIWSGLLRDCHASNKYLCNHCQRWCPRFSHRDCRNK
ncbi:MAG: penicillin-binding transpeptidase domain-containing protein [Actinomycetota bacterium]